LKRALAAENEEDPFMATATLKTQEPVLTDKVESLIAIGAATAANCIPCFEHLYEKAVTAGISAAQIKRPADIAGQGEKRRSYRPDKQRQ
jgi:alkylhydroperoxidase/carboxymuconolactone decarboxylase family protein YurZ